MYWQETRCYSIIKKKKNLVFIPDKNANKHLCPQLIRLINRNSLSNVHLVSLLYQNKKNQRYNNSITHKNAHKIRSTWHNFCLVHKIQYVILSNPIHSSISLFYIILTDKWKKLNKCKKKKCSEYFQILHFKESHIYNICVSTFTCNFWHGSLYLILTEIIRIWSLMLNLQ